MAQQIYKLLLLDDDPLEHRALQRQLNSTSHDDIFFEVFSALNVLSFEEYLCCSEQFDFIILDILLAEDSSPISGLNLIEKTKKAHPKATLLMSSNLDDPSSVLESLRLGADEFLSKKSRTAHLAQRFISLHKKSLIKKRLSYRKRKFTAKISFCFRRYDEKNWPKNS